MPELFPLPWWIYLVSLLYGAFFVWELIKFFDDEAANDECCFWCGRGSNDA